MSLVHSFCFHHSLSFLAIFSNKAAICTLGANSRVPSSGHRKIIQDTTLEGQSWDVIKIAPRSWYWGRPPSRVRPDLGKQRVWASQTGEGWHSKGTKEWSLQITRASRAKVQNGCVANEAGEEEADWQGAISVSKLEFGPLGNYRWGFTTTLDPRWSSVMQETQLRLPKWWKSNIARGGPGLGMHIWRKVGPCMVQWPAHFTSLLSTADWAMWAVFLKTVSK